MIGKVFSAALAAGFGAACLALLLQALLTMPLIREAERYEGQAPHRHAAAVRLAHAPTGTASDAVAKPGQAEWQPGEGLPRLAFTGVATLASAVGYALVLLALMLASGAEPTLPRALAWGLAGFGAVNLAPAVGLPPELPGMGGEGLGARQLWWLGAVLGTGLGLYLLGVVRTPLAVALGLAAMAAPHLIGTPPTGGESAVPAALAAQFAARSLAIAAVFWAALGLGLGWAWERLGRTEPSPVPA